MRSQHLFALGNIRRKKVGAIMVALVIFAATLMSVLSVAILARLDAPFAAMFDRLSGSQLTLELDRRFQDIQAIEAWFAARPEVESTRLVTMAASPGSPRLLRRNGVDDSEVLLSLGLAEYDPDATTDHLEILEGEAAAGREPAAGTVWVPNSCARHYAMTVGDTLRIPVATGLADFRIGAIVIDPQQSPLGITNTYTLWLGRGEMAYYHPLAALTVQKLHVRTRGDADVAALEGAFRDSRPEAFTGQVISRNSLANAYGFIYRLIAGAMLAAAAMALLIALFAIHASIKNAVVADQRNIGIIKSLGFRPRDVMLAYTWQYFLLCAAAMPPALLGGYFLADLIGQQFMSALSVLNNSLDYWLMALVVLAAGLSLVTACAWCFARSAGRVKTVEALRLGQSALTSQPRDSRSSITARSMLPLELLLALRQLRAQARSGRSMVITAFLCGAILVFSLSFHDFMHGSARDFSFWGFPDAHVQVAVPYSDWTTAEYDALLRESGTVTKTAAIGYTFAGFPRLDKVPARAVFCDLLDGDFDDLGYQMLEGKIPASDQDIALSITLARQYGVTTEDTLSIMVSGQKLAYTVSGLFQCTNQFGQVCRMTMDGFRRGDPSARPHSLLVWLKDQNDADAFIAKVLHDFGLSATKPAEVLKTAVLSYVGSSMGIVALFFVIMLLASGTIVWSATTLEIESTRQTLGIYKAMGFAPSQLRSMLLFKNLALVLGGTLAGVAVMNLVQGSLIQLSLSGMGIVRVDLPFNPGTSLTVLAAMALLASATSWLASRPVQSLSIRYLAVE